MLDTVGIPDGFTLNFKQPKYDRVKKLQTNINHRRVRNNKKKEKKDKKNNKDKDTNKKSKAKKTE